MIEQQILGTAVWLSIEFIPDGDYITDWPENDLKQGNCHRIGTCFSIVARYDDHRLGIMGVYVGSSSGLLPTPQYIDDRSVPLTY